MVDKKWHSKTKKRTGTASGFLALKNLNKNAFQYDAYCPLQLLFFLPCMPPLPCTPSTMHVPLPHTYSLPHMPPCHACPHCHICSPVDRILDTRLLKYYLAATSLRAVMKLIKWNSQNIDNVISDSIETMEVVVNKRLSINDMTLKVRLTTTKDPI